MKTPLSFSEKVYGVVKKIPKGSVLSYKEVARRAGNIKAARAVGMIMKKNKNRSIPCHRVIRSDGAIGGYNRIRALSKRALLKREGYNY